MAKSSVELGTDPNAMACSLERVVRPVERNSDAQPEKASLNEVAGRAPVAV